MNKLVHYRFLFIFLLIVSCLNDDIDELQNSTSETSEQSTAAPLDFGASIEADFMGRIVNDDGVRVYNATVTIGNQTTQTDSNGVFSIQNAQVFEDFAFIKVTKDNFIKGSRALVPQTEGINSVEITLLRKNIVETVNSGESRQINYENSTVFLQGEYKYPDGTSYNGQVDVSLHYLPPNTPETFSMMPGMLLGEDTNGNGQAMETYGMLAVNLFDQAGEELDIVEGFPATLEFPVDLDQAGIAPNEIPLWYFDEDLGYWKEEGSAIRQGNTYVGEVSHFTWWNCDLPLDYVTLCMSLATNEQELSGNYIELVRDETGQIIYQGVLDQNGTECGLMPANEAITLNIYGASLECLNDVIYQEVLGPYNSDASLTIVIPQENLQSTLIVGTVLNCDNTLLEEGFGIVFDSNNGFITGPIPIANGELNYLFSYCADLNYKLKIYSPNSLSSSDFISIDLSGDQLDIGNIALCEDFSPIYVGDVYFSSQQDVDLFGAMGYIEIQGNVNFHNSFNSLLPLNSIEIISGDLILVIVGGLTDLSGLENLNSVDGRLIFNGVWDLENIEALSNLSHTQEIIFAYVPDLQSLQGIEGVNGMSLLALSYLNSLESLDILENMDLNELQFLDLHNIPNITSLNALNQIVSLNTCTIKSMDLIQNLEGLQNLLNVEVLQIGGDNVGNLLLDDFCALQNLFTNGTYNEDEIQIINNGYNPSVQDIIDGNCSL